MTVDDTVLNGFQGWLRLNEKSESTIEKYMREATGFAVYAGGRDLDKRLLLDYKADLSARGLSPRTVNAKITAVHALLDFMDLPGCKIRTNKIQRQVFREESKDLSRHDYEVLVDAAYRSGNPRLALILQAIACTGVRVSELQYFTVENIRANRADISLKSKIRTIFIPDRLAEKLLDYAGLIQVTTGPVFVTGAGNMICRRQIWREMKVLAANSGIDERKVYPHNLRHMFARLYYESCGDLVKLADILGHSDVNTTRIYLISTGAEHARQLDGLGLVK